MFDLLQLNVHERLFASYDDEETASPSAVGISQPKAAVARRCSSFYSLLSCSNFFLSIVFCTARCQLPESNYRAVS